MVDKIGSMARRRSLNGNDWTLNYRTEAVPPLPTSLPDTVDAGYKTLPATVPGCVELDLMRAGVLPDLYVGDNITEARSLEYGDWWYSTEFHLDESELERLALVFHGLDTFAEIYLNDVLVGTTDNMLIEHEFSIEKPARAGNNKLAIHLSSPLRRAEEFDYAAEYMQIEGSYESLWVRKAPHMFGWDIAPRIVSAGIYRAVELVQRPADRFRDFSLRTVSADAEYSTATLEFAFQLNNAPRGRDVSVRLTGIEPKSGARFDTNLKLGFLAGSVQIEVPDARLWYPRGYGEQPLYEIHAELLVDGVVSDEHRWRHGIRSVEVDWVPRPYPDGRFGISVNGEQVMILGTNWVPLDALHARDGERLARALELLDASHCNTVRCWGGNIYESDEFYDWCDEHGVLVWQDFALACARYPQEKTFQAMLEAEASSVIKRLRHHASLMLWSGSNENDDIYVDAGLEPDEDILTREVLPAAVHLHDPGRPYLLGSPSYPGELAHLGRLAPPEQHLWGDRAWFKDPFYSASTACFVSEIGFHGCPSVSSLSRFLPNLGDQIDPEDPTWRLHETTQSIQSPIKRTNRTQLMVDQANLLFGDKVGTQLDQFVPASQIAQAEAFKFVVENSRLNPRRTGVIWWNLLDCWPQTSDAVVDYYFEPKLAFQYLSRSQQPVCIAIDEADGWWHDVVLLVDGRHNGIVNYAVKSLRSQEIVLSGSADLSASQGNRKLGKVPRPQGAEDCYVIEWSIGSQHFSNHYLAGMPPYDLHTYLTEFLPTISAGAEGLTGLPQ